MKRIYLAGPLFSTAEQQFNYHLFEALINVGHTVFLPQEECKGVAISEVFEICKRGLDTSEIIIAILDGADADSGTCWECGYAYANNKPIIAIRTDFRESGDIAGFNAMLYYSASKIVIGSDYLIQIQEYINKCI